MGPRPACWSVTCATSLLLVACADDSRPVEGRDAGVDAWAFEPPAAPDPPTAPAAPVLTPCPPGWREVTSATGPTTCDPWPESGPLACAPDEAHFPGEASCSRVGPDCPAGDWPIGLPADGTPIVYVRPGPGGGHGGDGTLSSPFTTIAAATAVTTPGSVIALARGTYDEAVVVPAGVTLQGACVAETVVAPAYAANAPALRVAGADAVVRDLQVAGNMHGIRIDEGAAGRLENILVAGTWCSGIEVAPAGQLEGTSLAVRDTTVCDAGAFPAGGLRVDAGAGATITRAVVERPFYAGVSVTGAGADLCLTDAAVRDARPGSGSWQGGGVRADDGARVELHHVAIEASQWLGLSVSGAATAASLGDVVVRDGVSLESTDTGGTGIAVADAALLTGTRVLIERNRRAGVTVEGAGAAAALDDLVVRDTASEPDQTSGLGLAVSRGGALTLQRAMLERNRVFAVLCTQTGSRVDLRDVVARDTLPQASGELFGDGVVITDGCDAEVVRALVERSHMIGVLALGSGTLVHLADLAITDTDGVALASDRGAGFGLVVDTAATARVERLLVERSRTAGVVAGQDADVTITDLVVRDTRSQASDLHFGRGLSVQDGADVEVTRAVLERNRDVGVSCLQASVRLTDLLVIDTLPQECQAAGSCRWDVTNAVGAAYGGTIDVTRFELARSALCGVQAASDGTVDLHQGRVIDNPIGANVQTIGFDLARLSDLVLWLDNGVNLDTTALPVPEAINPLGD